LIIDEPREWPSVTIAELDIIGVNSLPIDRGNSIKPKGNTK